MNDKIEKKIWCKICLDPLVVSKTLAKLKCMCDEDVRIIPLDRIFDREFEHLIYVGEFQ
jgi:hypothetical protein